MSEGVTLLIIVSMLAAGMISVIMAERRERSLMSGGDWKQLPMLVACDLLFVGSFCVVLFYLYIENMINPRFVTAGWQIGLLVIVIAYLSFGVKRVWKIIWGEQQKGSTEEKQSEKEQSEKKRSEKKQSQADGIAAYMQYALIYMALALLVILAAEILLCSVLPYIDKGQALTIMGVAVNWGDVREQLLGAVLICSLIGFILSTVRVGQECVFAGRETRQDRMEEVKRYLRQ